MKVCPHCKAELRNSVIRCTSCGRSLSDPAGEDRDRGPSADATPSAETAAAPAPAAVATASAPKIESAWATPVAPPKTWSGSPTRSNGPGANLVPDLAGRRALPGRNRRPNHPDLPMIAAAVATGYAAYMAWGAISLRWVQITISQATDDAARELGTASFGATDAVVGTLLQALVVVMGAMAVLWLFFGLQRGWSMPWFASPAIGIVTALGCLATTIVSSLLWFVWREAVTDRAAAYGRTRRSLVALLDDPESPPLVDLHRLGGPQRFGTMIVVALVASCVGWWAYRNRSA